MALKTLEDAFLEELRDVLNAERQITKALPKMAKKASHEPLKQAFELHLDQTEHQIERLEDVFESIGKKPRSRRCEGMEGIIGEGKELLHEDAEPAVLDAMMISAAQRVEHYEMAVYGTLCAWAETLGHSQALKLLQETLAEEKETDEKLNKLAATINPKSKP